MGSETLTGRVISVGQQRYGSTLTADAAIGATVLHVAETGDFDEAGGQVLVGGDLYDYFDVDETALTITINPALSVASAEDDPVDIFHTDVGTIVVEYVALMLLDDQDPDDRPIEVGINHALADLLEEKIRGGGAETVTLTPDGPDDYIISQVDGKTADNVAVAEVVVQAGDAMDQAEAALTAAQLAQAILDGEIDYYYTTSAPWADGSSAHDDDIGDVWVDTDSFPKHAYRWLNRTWTLIADGGLVATLFAAQDAQITADGKIKHFVGGLADFGGSPPVADGYGDVWTNEDYDNLRLYWDGDSWEPLLVGDEAIVTELIAKTFTGGLFRTAASGTRLEIADDLAGGVMQFIFSGGGSPGYINPLSPGGVYQLWLNSGHPSSRNAATIKLISGVPGVEEIRLSASNVVVEAGDLEVQGDLTVSGSYPSSGSSWVGSATSNLDMNNNAINDVDAINNGGGIIDMAAEIRPNEIRLTSVPVSTGGQQAYMGSLGAIFARVSPSMPDWKRDVTEVTVDRDALADLGVSTYRYCEDVEFPVDDFDQIFYGWMYPDAQALGLTDLIGEGPQGMPIARPENLPFVLLAAWQGDHAELVELRTETAELRAAIAALTDRLDAMEAP